MRAAILLGAVLGALVLLPTAAPSAASAASSPGASARPTRPGSTVAATESRPGQPGPLLSASDAALLRERTDNFVCKAVGLFSTLLGDGCSVVTKVGTIVKIGGRLVRAGGKLVTGHLGGAVGALLGSGGGSTGSGIATKALAAAALLAIGIWAVHGAQAALNELAHVIGAVTSPDLTAGWFTPVYGRVGVIALLLTLPFLFAAAIQAVLRSDLGLLLRAAFGYLPLAVLAVFLATPLIISLLDATDGMSSFVGGSAGDAGGRFLVFAGAATAGLGTFAGSAFLGLFLGLALAAVAMAITLELLVREAAIYIVVLMLPLAFASMVWPARRVWVVRALEMLVALILSKFVIVAVLTLAESALGTLAADGIGTVLAGFTLLLLAAFSPWVLMKLIPFTEMAAGFSGALGNEQRRLGGHFTRAAGLDVMMSGAGADTDSDARPPLPSDDSRARARGNAPVDPPRWLDSGDGDGDGYGNGDGGGRPPGGGGGSTDDGGCDDDDLFGDAPTEANRLGATEGTQPVPVEAVNGAAGAGSANGTVRSGAGASNGARPSSNGTAAPVPGVVGAEIDARLTAYTGGADEPLVLGRPPEPPRLGSRPGRPMLGPGPSGPSSSQPPPSGPASREPGAATDRPAVALAPAPGSAPDRGAGPAEAPSASPIPPSSGAPGSAVAPASIGPAGDLVTNAPSAIQVPAVASPAIDGGVPRLSGGPTSGPPSGANPPPTAPPADRGREGASGPDPGPSADLPPLANDGGRLDHRPLAPDHEEPAAPRPMGEDR